MAAALLIMLTVDTAAGACTMNVAAATLNAPAHAAMFVADCRSGHRTIPAAPGQRPHPDPATNLALEQLDDDSSDNPPPVVSDAALPPRAVWTAARSTAPARRATAHVAFPNHPTYLVTERLRL